jgi:hypothetical protein
MDHLDQPFLTAVGVVWLRLASRRTGRAFALVAAAWLR